MSVDAAVRPYNIWGNFGWCSPADAALQCNTVQTNFARSEACARRSHQGHDLMILCLLKAEDSGSSRISQ